MRNLEVEGHDNLCVGIDLGTTNSVLATINKKQNGDIVSKVVEISRGVDMYNAVSGEVKFTTMKKPTLPSCVYYREEKNYEPLVGDFAKMQYSLRPHLVAKSIKSQMGNRLVKGLSPDIPDKTPAQVSSRILKHLLREASRVNRCNITDAVITVPANFDSAMCKATRDAAELAGIKVKNSDGSERPVLLSEPNAVIYDLINQIHNGEISNYILDLNEKKRVLVFDLGGGTLDITMHEIKRRGNNKEVLKVDEIATNRYTRLGGDDFDEELAKEMYSRYLKKYENHPDVAAKLRKNEKVIMPQLRVYAEYLKLELNERCGDGYASGWDDEEDEIEIPIGGNMGGIGYSYDDTFSQEEIENILSTFMAPELTYDDYKKIEKITDTRNIIYPILDVLNKAAAKMEEKEVTVDAVIVNGGMSKFYMVINRLRDFFGFEPIVALDPDQAVARGAAVYHYYLHKYEEMQDDMKLLGKNENTDGSTEYSGIEKKAAVSMMNIQWGKNILNDCLYLGVKNGVVHEIIPTGAELPYTSPRMNGFRVESGQNMIEIPIKSQNLDGTYRIIASGVIHLKRDYQDGAYLSFMVHMGSNKIITMEAWTSKDREGTEKIEEASVNIVIDNSERVKVKAKMITPSGSNLQPKAEINNMLQLCQNYEKCRNKTEKKNISKRIASSVKSICDAGNKEDFAPVILEAFQNVASEEARQRLFIIARKIGTEWSDDDKKRLALVCMEQISADINGFSIGGPRISTNVQAIYTMSICANMKQLRKLSVLHDTSKYFQACLYTQAKTKSDLQWIQDKFEEDVKRSRKGWTNNIQFTSYAIGIALRKDNLKEAVVGSEKEGKMVKQLCKAISTGRLSDEELSCCLLALGWICDQREKSSDIDRGIIQEAFETIRNIDDYYKVLTVMKQVKHRSVAIKMLNGDQLNDDEEKFLLTKLEK